MFFTLRKKNIIAVSALVIVLGLMFTLPRLDAVQTAASQNEIQLPIIMYHQIAHKNKNLGKYVTTDAQFEKDLEFLTEHGYRTINMTQLIDYVKNGTPLPPKPVMLTFDDGQESFYAYILPILEKHRAYAVMSIVGEYVDTYTKLQDHYLSYSYMDWSEIDELVKSPWAEVQNHTYNMHSNNKGRLGCKIKKGESVNDYTIALNSDIGRLQEEIFKRTGWQPNTFTYPYGYFCKESVPILKALGFEATLTCTEKINVITRDASCLFGLGRYNRPNGLSSEDFFKKVGI